MVCGRIFELTRATADLPALATQRIGRAHAKAVTILLLVVLQPLQRLTLGTGDTTRGLKRSNDRHARFELRHHGHSPGLANFTFGLAMNVTQISNHNVWSPSEAMPAVADAGLEQISLGNISRREPTDDRDQANRFWITVEPQLQRVLFVADIKPCVARLE